MTRDGRVHWMLEQGEGGRRSPHDPSTAPCKRTQRRHPLSARGMALSLPCDLTLNVSLQELVSGLDRAQQGHSGHGNRTAMGGCNQSSQACAPGAPLPVGLSMGQGPYTPLWFQLPTRHPRRHQWQTQTGSCSAGNFIKGGLGMRTKAPTGQGTQAQDALRRRHLQVTDSRSLVRTSQATVRPRLPRPGRQARAPLPGPASADGRLRRTRDRVSRSVRSPPPSLRPVSCRKLHPCRFPECARSPLGSERVQRATVLQMATSPSLQHLPSNVESTFPQEAGGVPGHHTRRQNNTQPAVIGCTTWGPTSAAPAPHLRGSCRAPREGQARAIHLYGRRGWGDFTSGITLLQREEMES